MSKTKRVLLLVGSPRAMKSTSRALGTYLLELLVQTGIETKEMSIVQYIRSEKGLEQLCAAMSISDVIVLSFPLYIDSLPSPVIKVMEFVSQKRSGTDNTHSHRILTICNSGFPEAVHSDVALAICKKFACEAGFDWIGGLALGGGEAIGGESLKDAGGKARFVRKALELTAAAITADRAVPEEAIKLMARPFIPQWVYILFGGLGWKLKALRKRAFGKINDRPYHPENPPRKNSHPAAHLL